MKQVVQYIQQFKKGDYSCFDKFYELTSKQVYFTSLAVLKNPHSAEEIMQETYVSFLNNIDSFDQNKNVYAYLTVIARNKSINVYNKDKRLAMGDDHLTNIPVHIDTNVGGVEQILAHLPDELSREIVTYHVILGYKFNEIAKITEKPLGTVLWKYNKAMKTLRSKAGDIL